MDHIDLIIPHLDETSIVKLMLSSRLFARITIQYYNNLCGWDNHTTDSLATKISMLLNRLYCKYCKKICDIRGCPQHWCDGCYGYYPVYHPDEPKHPYICQKCSPCESCGMAAKTYKYVNVHEYGISRIEFATVICDNCTTHCVCGSDDIRLCTTDDFCLVRCPRCIQTAIHTTNTKFSSVITYFTIE